MQDMLVQHPASLCLFLPTQARLWLIFSFLLLAYIHVFVAHS